MFKLAQTGAVNRGLSCSKDGLFLGAAALIECHDGDGYRIRLAAEIEALLAAAYETPSDLAHCLAALREIATDLRAGRLALAQIRALQLRFDKVSGGSHHRPGAD